MLLQHSKEGDMSFVVVTFFFLFVLFCCRRLFSCLECNKEGDNSKAHVAFFFCWNATKNAMAELMSSLSSLCLFAG